MSIRLRVALVAVLAVVLAANAGAAIYAATAATAAAAAPTIRACVSTKTGAMRYVPSKACAKGETAITWNVAGPVGPAEPPAVYTSEWTTMTLRPAGPPKPYDLATVSLPAGSYDVRATGWLESTGGGTDTNPQTTTYECTFASFTWHDRWAYPGTPSQRPFAFEKVETLTEPGSISVQCTLVFPGASRSATAQAFIIATPVTSK